MPNPSNPLPPFPPPQPGDQQAQLNSANEKAIAQFLYTAGPGGSPLPLPPPPTGPLLKGIHFEYAVSKTIAKVSGLCCTPVCGPPGTPMSTTRETAPWGKMAVRWKAARNNGAPALPSEDMQDPNLVLERSWITFQGQGIMADGTGSQVVEGIYVFWCRIPYGEVDTVLVAAYPDTGGELTLSSVGPTNYLKGIIGPNQPPKGAPTNPIAF